MRKVLVLLAALAVAFTFMASLGFAENKELPKDQVIAIATTALKGEGIEAKDVDVIYDEGGKLWEEELGYIKEEDQSPNYGILKQGFLKNYRIVFYDFKEPLKDVWVFVDKDTGEVLGVYRD